MSFYSILELDDGTRYIRMWPNLNTSSAIPKSTSKPAVTASASPNVPAPTTENGSENAISPVRAASGDSAEQGQSNVMLPSPPLTAPAVPIRVPIAASDNQQKPSKGFGQRADLSLLNRQRKYNYSQRADESLGRDQASHALRVVRMFRTRTENRRTTWMREETYEPRVPRCSLNSEKAPEAKQKRHARTTVMKLQHAFRSGSEDRLQRAMAPFLETDIDDVPVAAHRPEPVQLGTEEVELGEGRGEDIEIEKPEPEGPEPEDPDSNELGAEELGCERSDSEHSESVEPDDRNATTLTSKRKAGEISNGVGNESEQSCEELPTAEPRTRKKQKTSANTSARHKSNLTRSSKSSKRTSKKAEKQSTQATAVATQTAARQPSVEYREHAATPRPPPSSASVRTPVTARSPTTLTKTKSKNYNITWNSQASLTTLRSRCSKKLLRDMLKDDGVDISSVPDNFGATAQAWIDRKDERKQGAGKTAGSGRKHRV